MPHTFLRKAHVKYKRCTTKCYTRFNVIFEIKLVYSMFTRTDSFRVTFYDRDGFSVTRYFGGSRLFVYRICYEDASNISSLARSMAHCSIPNDESELKQRRLPVVYSNSFRPFVPVIFRPCETAPNLFHLSLVSIKRPAAVPISSFFYGQANSMRSEMT